MKRMSAAVISVAVMLVLLCFAGCNENSSGVQNASSRQSAKSTESIASSSIPSAASSENASSIHTNKYIYNVQVYEIPKAGWDYEDVDFSFEINDQNILDRIKPIKNDEDAIAVGRNIIKEYHKIGKFPAYELCDIIHYNDNESWQFTYSITPQYEIDVSIDEWRTYVEGGIFYIAVDGATGQLLKAWVGE